MKKDKYTNFLVVGEKTISHHHSKYFLNLTSPLHLSNSCSNFYRPYLSPDALSIKLYTTCLVYRAFKI